MDASGGGTEVVDGAAPLDPTGVVSRGVLTVGGIVAEVATRSVTGAIRADLSLYPTRKPSEKKTPQTATPAKNTRIRCRVESPLSPGTRSAFLTMVNLLIPCLRPLVSPAHYLFSPPGAVWAPAFASKALNSSTGIGKTMVVFLSVPISAKV